MYHKAVDEVLRALKTNENGLTWEEAAERQRQYGLNEIGRHHVSNFWKVLFHQATNPLFLLLLFSAVIAFAVNSPTDGIGILIAAFLSFFIGFWQEYKAEESLKHLQQYMQHTCRVLRGGKEERIAPRFLVPGDVVLLSEGDMVPADCRVMEANGLLVDEAILTGESTPVAKDSAPVPKDAPLHARRSMVFAGTRVVQGSAKAVVVAIGDKTQIGRIAQSLENVESSDLPLEKEIKTFVKVVSGIGVIASALYFILSGGEILKSIALFVAAIPEGMPTVLAITLSMGIDRVGKKGIVFKRLSAVQASGSITTLVVDKTGTLTMGKLHIAKVLSPRDDLLEIAGRCVDPLGNDPVDSVLKMPGIKPWRVVVPFSSEKKYMVVQQGHRRIMKGAWEVVLRKCTHVLTEKGKRRRDAIEDHIIEMGRSLEKQGYKVIGVAEGPPYTFLGFVCLEDPVRPNVKELIQTCDAAGIRVLMVTGDGLMTAKVVADKIGLKGKAIYASQIEMEKDLAGVSVVARATPADKLKIVEMLQRQGEIVAVSGDGVNDAPALKKANLGIAVGEATDVSKETADIVLTNPSFESMIHAIREGRGIMHSIVRFSVFQLTANVALFFNALTSLVVGGGLTPVQILFINLVMDGPPSLAIALKPIQTLKKPPKLLSKKNLVKIGLAGLSTGAIGLMTMNGYEAFITMASGLLLTAPVLSRWDKNTLIVSGAGLLTLVGLSYALPSVMDVAPLSGRVLLALLSPLSMRIALALTGEESGK